MNDQMKGFDPANMSRAEMMEELALRSWGAHCAEIALSLAQQAGEATPRPLSREQLARGFQANETETHLLLVMLDDYWRKSPPRA